MAWLFKGETTIEPEIGNTLSANDPGASKRLLVLGEREHFDQRAFGEESQTVAGKSTR